MYITGAKGAAARKIREEEGGTEHVEEAAPEEDEGERELGKVKVRSFLTPLRSSMACDVVQIFKDDCIPYYIGITSQTNEFQQYNEEKGFAFIAPCQGGDEYV